MVHEPLPCVVSCFISVSCRSAVPPSVTRCALATQAAFTTPHLRVFPHAPSSACNTFFSLFGWQDPWPSCLSFNVTSVERQSLISYLNSLETPIILSYSKHSVRSLFHCGFYDCWQLCILFVYLLNMSDSSTLFQVLRTEPVKMVST